MIVEKKKKKNWGGLRLWGKKINNTVFQGKISIFHYGTCSKDLIKWSPG